MGAVSVQIWGTACATVVQMAGEAVASGWVLVQKQGGDGGKEKVAMGAEGGGSEGEKKEL